MKNLLPCTFLLTLSLMVSASAQSTYNLNYDGGATTRNWTVADTWNPGIAGGPTALDSISITGSDASRLITVNTGTASTSTSTPINNFTYNATDQVIFRGGNLAGSTINLDIAGDLLKQGSGELVFEGANSNNSNGRMIVNVGGSLTVSSGTLGFGTADPVTSSADRNGAVNVAGLTTVASGAALRVASGSTAPNHSNFNGGMNLLGSLHVGRGLNAPASTNMNIAGLSGSGSISVPIDASTANTLLVRFTQGGGSSSTFTGNISQGTNTAIALQMAGSGRQIFTGTLTNTGNITFATGSDGVLQFSNATALSSTSNIIISEGGTIGLGFDLSRDLATSGTGIVNWSNPGGFAAYGGDRSLTFNGGATLTPGTTAGFNTATSEANAFSFGHETADGTITLTNAINTTNTRWFRVHNGAAAVDARFSGALTGTGIFTTTGEGTLELTGANTRGGAMSVQQGTLIIAGDSSFGGGNLRVEGGILGLGNSDMTRSVGAGGTAIRVQEDGTGFAAFYADRTLNFGGSANVTNWGSANFMTDSSILTLNTDEATHTLTWVNGVNLDDGVRTFQVGNSAAAIDARMTGVISGGDDNIGGITKDGAGVLELTANNTYGGATTINAGTLLLAATGSINSSSSVMVNAAGTLDVSQSPGLTIAAGHTLGGTGTLIGDLHFAEDAQFVFNLSAGLTVNDGNVTFTNFGIGNLIGLDSSVGVGTFSVITGSADIDTAGLLNFGASNPFDLGDGLSAYFEAGSLNVVVIPEPGSAALAGLAGVLLLLRRLRRAVR